MLDREAAVELVRGVQEWAQAELGALTRPGCARRRVGAL